MVPVPVEPFPREYLYNFWDNLPSETIELTCLMPNGVIILLEVNCNATFSEIKEDLWDHAPQFPLYGKLHDMSVYIFSHVNCMAERVEIIDESRRLSDVRPTGAVLTISECKSNSLDHSINIQIGQLIGKRLQEFDDLSSSEINDFRFKMRKMGDEIAKERSKYTWQEKLFYQFPPRLVTGTSCISENKNFKIITKFEHSTTFSESFDDNSKDVTHSSFTFNVLPSMSPNELLDLIFMKRATRFNIPQERSSEYVLKVCGQDEYLVGEYQFIQFQYIQDCISKELTPTLVTVHKNRVPVILSNDYECLEMFDTKKPKPSFSTLTLRKKGKYKSSWSIEENFSITLNTVSKLNCDTKKQVEIGIQAGLFHGGKTLCQPIKTKDIPMNEKCECHINETLIFDIKVCDIPRNSKLCFAVYELNKTVKGTKSKKFKENSKDSMSNPVVWANTTVYDFKSQLNSGAMTLYMWTYAEDMVSDEIFHPLGTVVSNPNTEYSTALTLFFNSYSKDQTVMFPCVETIMSFASERLFSAEPSVDPYMVENLTKLLQESDNVLEIHDQDRKNIWQLKHYWCKHVPEMLPKLLNCIDWNKREEVSEVVALLREWPRLPVEKSLELLDYAYADQEVRSFAVKWLKDLSDEDLLLYLLQLVQAIKHELYLECDLVNFLITRALSNQKIGHYLFWHLRSEMTVPAVSVRFGLILEAYCRGSQEHMSILMKQLECLEKLKKCSENVRNRRDKEKARAALKEFLEDSHSVDAVKHVRSPLDPSFRCTRIKMDKCKVMDSKMKPLLIVFENADMWGDDVFIIFKNGDDLRQDMLTLQMLRIMDRLWKREGLDLRMNPYDCISMEHRVGMIEVVLNADTIANIQKEKGMFSATSAFRKTPILAWLKDYNTSEASLNKAVNEFTLSCAGYCVATYVLGIADRHPDNIMVKKNGQLFHIDFGHILGHFKEKFGFKRERVPFVLTHDFVFVINKGQKNAGLEFKIFQEVCEKAFMILRKHGSLIMSLCAMMISTGLPELTSEKDLKYLRDTLVLSKTDDDAIQHFRCKFDEALSNSWKTSLNWASHNIAKNNKTY